MGCRRLLADRIRHCRGCIRKLCVATNSTACAREVTQAAQRSRQNVCTHCFNNTDDCDGVLLRLRITPAAATATDPSAPSGVPAATSAASAAIAARAPARRRLHLLQGVAAVAAAHRRPVHGSRPEPRWRRSRQRLRRRQRDGRRQRRSRPRLVLRRRRACGSALI